jgi:hypothetical protein
LLLFDDRDDVESIAFEVRQRDYRVVVRPRLARMDRSTGRAYSGIWPSAAAYEGPVESIRVLRFGEAERHQG